VSEQDQEKAKAKRQQWEEHNRAKAEAKQQEREGKSDGMASSRQFQAVKGTRDLLPPETALWNYVERTASDVFGTYGFGEIRLPIFESTELFARSIGLDTDVVSKEMYTFPDHALWDVEGQRTDLILRRPDLSNSHSVALFSSQLDSLIKRIETALSNGEIAKTPDNERAFEQLRAGSDGISKFLVPQTAGSESEQFDLRVKFIQDAAATLRLGDLLTLRPEATASVCRAYVEHGMQSLPQPVRLCYLGPMFRRERPQKGRYRQFYQIGAEVLGPSDSPRIDAELIEMLIKFFERVGLRGTTLHINSIGDLECRPHYVERLRTELLKVKHKLGPDSQRRIETNPLRVLDSKVEDEQAVIENLPRITEYLCQDCAKNYEQVKRELDLRGVKYQENWRLVRGLDYYVRTTFEVTAQGLGSQNAICGGGRYDGLVELIGGSKFRNIKATGFAIGQDRLILALQHRGAETGKRIDVFMAWKDEASRPHAESVARLLRDSGLRVEVPFRPMSPGEGLGLASKLNVPIGIVIGPGEASANTVSMRLLAERDQVSLGKDKLAGIEMRRLLTFRILLEQELVQLAIISDVEYKDTPIPVLADRLVKKELLPAHLKVPIDMATSTFNALIHGNEVAHEHLSEAIAASVMVIDELTTTSGKYGISLGG
jgi:histidyl-tRNA synthetase